MPELLAIYYNPYALFLWGACWGSFINVVLYRWPKGLSVIRPASACPSCEKSIAWYDNIPILSWFLLRGKCRHCKQPFSIRYALNEALYGAIWAAVALIWPEEPLTGTSAGVTLTAAIPTVWLMIHHNRAPLTLMVIMAVSAVCGLLLIIF